MTASRSPAAATVIDARGPRTVRLLGARRHGRGLVCRILVSLHSLRPPAARRDGPYGSDPAAARLLLRRSRSRVKRSSSALRGGRSALRRVSRRGEHFAVEVDAPSSLARARLERDVVRRARAEPAARGGAASARGPRTRISCSRDRRPERRELDPPGQRARPGDVGDRGPLEHLARARRTGASSHSDESTTTRSATSTSCSHCGSPNGGSPRQRRKTGRSEISSGSTIDAGAARAVAAQMQLDHLAADRPVADREAAHRELASSPSGSSGCGTRITVRDGWRSAMPSSVRSAASSHCGGAQAMCVITLVRWCGCAPSPRRRVAQPRQLALDLGDRDIHAGPVLDRARISAFARTGRRGAAARRPTAGPRCRRRSSGTTAGRAATTRRSRRPAPTAPRSRPTA